MKKFVLPNLPYAFDGLEPVLSKETLEYHYGKHHAGYINKLNELIENTEFADSGIVDIIRKSDGVVFNNAAQAYNHAFYWMCMQPPAEGNKPTGRVDKALIDTFGGYQNFMEQFSESATRYFGSGWVWLVQKSSGDIEIEASRDADTPVKKGHNPLLVIDVWEHAYYIDYRNRRSDYIKEFWRLINWDFVDSRLESRDLDNLISRE